MEHFRSIHGIKKEFGIFAKLFTCYICELDIQSSPILPIKICAQISVNAPAIHPDTIKNDKYDATAVQWYIA